MSRFQEYEAYDRAERQAEELCRGWRASVNAARKLCADCGIDFLSSRAQIGLECSKVIAYVLNEVHACRDEGLQAPNEEDITDLLTYAVETFDTQIPPLGDDGSDNLSY